MSEAEAKVVSIKVAHHGVRLAPGARFRILVDDTGPRIVPAPNGTCMVEACESRIVHGEGRRLITTYRKLPPS